jgi:hypothetical protein
MRLCYAILFTIGIIFTYSALTRTWRTATYIYKRSALATDAKIAPTATDLRGAADSKSGGSGPEGGPAVGGLFGAGVGAVAGSVSSGNSNFHSSTPYSSVATVKRA